MSAVVFENEAVQRAQRDERMLHVAAARAARDMQLSAWYGVDRAAVREQKRRQPDVGDLRLAFLINGLRG